MTNVHQGCILSEGPLVGYVFIWLFLCVWVESGGRKERRRKEDEEKIHIPLIFKMAPVPMRMASS